MKNIRKGVGKIILYHILFIFLTLTVVPALAMLSDIMSLIVGGIAVYLYSLMMYSIGWRFGSLDSRRAASSNDGAPKFLHGEDPNVRLKRVMKATIIATIPTAVLLALRIAAPILFAETQIRVTDLIYRIWLTPFLPFFRGFASGINIAYILPMFIIPIFTVFGYSVGLKRFSLVEKIFPKILYKNRPNKDKEAADGRP